MDMSLKNAKWARWRSLLQAAPNEAPTLCELKHRRWQWGFTGICWEQHYGKIEKFCISFPGLMCVTHLPLSGSVFPRCFFAFLPSRCFPCLTTAVPTPELLFLPIISAGQSQSVLPFPSCHCQSHRNIPTPECSQPACKHPDCPQRPSSRATGWHPEWKPEPHELVGRRCWEEGLVTANTEQQPSISDCCCVTRESFISFQEL